MKEKQKLTGNRLKLYEIIFEADTPAGRTFDLTLLACILASVFIVIIESVENIRATFGFWLPLFEWTFTIIFTIEYFARLWVVPNKRKYIFSFFGVIDLLSILPTYLGLFLVGAHSLMVIRSIRLLRVFRILKLPRFVGSEQILVSALKASQHKIIIFLITVITWVTIIGAIMFLIEGPAHGFTSIPKSIYWAIVTMTTVGYGDIAPQTALGQGLASLTMILGYGIIAVPTGIVSSEMIKYNSNKKLTTQRCPNCLKEGHDADAVHCKYCGNAL